MKIKLIIPLIIMALLCSCTQVVTDKADEVRLNNWSAALGNENRVSLSFDGDTAEFKVQSDDSDAAVTLKGVGVVDNNNILIYNQSESEPYFFTYKIKNNTLILGYDGGRLTLTRDN